MERDSGTMLVVSFMVVIFILAGTVYVSMLARGSATSSEETPVSRSAPVPAEEKGNMLGVWVPYMTLDMSKQEDRSEAAFKQKFDNIVLTSKQSGINTLIVQVRAFADAMYPSAYFPYSHLLSGIQGQDPGFDPLAYMISATHSAQMEFHAWLNPYRIQRGNTPESLAPGNMYNVWLGEIGAPSNDFAVDYEGSKYYNPAYPEVRELIINGVREIVRGYDVDAIHFDDYFYPSGASPDFDEKAYTAYLAGAGDGAMDLNSFRKENVNLLIRDTYKAIKQEKPSARFGISPQGNIENDEAMGADVRLWCRESGYIDYICPQIYYNFENPTLPFDKSANQWKSIVTNPDTDLYFGLALYKTGSPTYDNGTWLHSNDILKRQVEYSAGIGVRDFMIYSFDYLTLPECEQEARGALTAAAKL